VATRQAAVCRAALVAASLLFAVPGADAAPVTYTEVIADVSGAPVADFFDFTRDLRRTRTLGSGAVSVEDVDATIVGDNLIGDGFGVSTLLTAVGWTHTFIAAPGVATFLSASLTLEVFGADDFPDIVFVEFFPIGAVTPVGPDGFSTTVISTDIIGDPTLIDFVLGTLLADGALNVTVLPLLLDFTSIRSSTFSVTYEPVSVPEPSTALLVLGGLVAAGCRPLRRRHVFR
jgi:hypothetical protein